MDTVRNRKVGSGRSQKITLKNADLSGQKSRNLSAAHRFIYYCKREKYPRPAFPKKRNADHGIMTFGETVTRKSAIG